MHRSRQVSEGAREIRRRRIERQLRNDLNDPGNSANPERVMAILKYIQNSVVLALAHLSLNSSQPRYPEVASISFHPPISLSEDESHAIENLMRLELQEAIAQGDLDRLKTHFQLARLSETDINGIAQNVLGEVKAEISRAQSYPQIMGENGRLVPVNIGALINFPLHRVLNEMPADETIGVIADRIALQLRSESHCIDERVAGDGLIYWIIS